jgi:hypothetical protein
VNLDQKSAFGPVRSCDASAMEADGAFGNGQTQTNAASLPASSIVQAVKRLEQLFQRIGGNAEAAIGDSDDRFLITAAFCPVQMDLNRRAFAGVADGVAHNILDRTVQQGCISADSPTS